MDRGGVRFSAPIFVPRLISAVPVLIEHIHKNVELTPLSRLTVTERQVMLWPRWRPPRSSRSTQGRGNDVGVRAELRTHRRARYPGGMGAARQCGRQVGYRWRPQVGRGALKSTFTQECGLTPHFQSDGGWARPRLWTFAPATILPVSPHCPVPDRASGQARLCLCLQQWRSGDGRR